MKIETKYNVGQEVWFMYDNKPRKDRPYKIEYIYNIKNNKEEVYYTFPKFIDVKYLIDIVVKESDVFSTKEKLINSL